MLLTSFAKIFDLDKNLVYYIFDPLCSWCYGFTPVLQKFAQLQTSELEFRVMCGGMLIGDSEVYAHELGEDIKKGFSRIAELSGQTFGEAFYKRLEQTDLKLSSLPGSLAMATLRYYQPDQALEFAHEIQKAFYKEGKNPVSVQTYGECAEDFGMNASDFMRLMVDKERLQIVQKEFEIVRNWKVGSFPTLLYQNGEKALLFSRGYCSLEELNQRYELAKEKLRA